MKLTLTTKRQEASDVTTFVFKPETPIEWQAGQFLHYTLPHDQPDDRGIERWFTISSAPYERHVTITTRFAYKTSSSFKKALFSLREGDTITADGPEGEFVLSRGEKSQYCVFIAGGIGITPFRAMLLQQKHEHLSISTDLFYLNRDDHFVFDDEIRQLASEDLGLTLHAMSGAVHLQPNDMESVITNMSETLFYVSGPRPMVDAYEAMLLQMGITKSAIKRDAFPGYDMPKET